MKAIIDGKRYDTTTAELIHKWDNDRFAGDFRRREKHLYRTQKGAWFIHHIGGPMTDMARSVGSNSVTGSERIEPISEDDAFHFLVTHNGEEKAEKYFPDRIENA